MGCILAELLQRKPLFPGKDYIDQLKLIIKTLGSPSDSDLSFINSQKAQQYIKALPKAQVSICLPVTSSSTLMASLVSDSSETCHVLIMPVYMRLCVRSCNDGRLQT